MAYTAKTKIIHNRKSYAPGDEIPDLRKSDADRLLSLNAIEGEGDHKKEEVYLTPDEFRKLETAKEQSDYLKKVGLQPAKNDDDRFTQYERWYDPNR